MNQLNEGGQSMPATDERTESLTIYLAKEGFVQPADCLKDPTSLAEFSIRDDVGDLGKLYVQTRADNPPRWGRFFVPQVSPAQLGRVSSTAAVLHVVIGGRAMFVTFGQGRHLLENACLEDRFGLRVTLNAIGENKVRSIDKHTLDTVGRHTRVQVTREAGTSEFGIDIERDLLRAITGTPIDAALGKTLSGFESLHINARVNLNGLRDLLQRYLEHFEKDTFKQTFPWVDYVSEVKDPAQRDTLDTSMLATIQNQRHDKCWLALPEPIEWARVAGFRYGFSRKRPLHNDVELATFLADTNIALADLTLQNLRARDVCAVDGDDMSQYSWPVYKCLYCEIEHDGETYLLSTGKWYKISSDFVTQVNNYMGSLSRFEIALPPYADVSEEAYNERVASKSAYSLCLMDRKLISVGGGHSKVEFCDLIGNETDLIHIKRYGGSGVLSHLFMQGLVAGQLFMSDPGFRAALNEVLPQQLRLADPATRPDPAAYRVVFAIVSSEQGSSLTLPFFSRLSLRNAAQILRGYGYRVALGKISVEEAYEKTAKFTKARRSR